MTDTERNEPEDQIIDPELTIPVDDEPENAPEAKPEDKSKPAPPSEEEDLFSPTRLNRSEICSLIVALLYAAGETITIERFSDYFQIDPAELEIWIEEAAGQLRPLGLDILCAAGGYRLVTASQWDSYLRQFHRKLKKARLSKGALEILAVIAYEQPVTRARVDELRQVNSESTVRTLLDKRLITVAGRADTPGRPFLYRTTNLFLETFGLESLTDLPPKPESFEAAEGVNIGSMEDSTPGGLEDLPGFDVELVEDQELED